MTSQLRALFSTTFSTNPQEQQRRLVEGFQGTLSRTRLMQWQVVDAIPSGVFLLVGVMVGWNTYDQELAASLDEAVVEGRTGNDLIAMLAADDLTSSEEIEAIFPGLRHAVQSPFVGLWEDARLMLVDSGPSATAFLSDRYGLRLP